MERVVLGVGLSLDTLDTPATLASGGERTRAALARALLADPDLLVMDEPTNYLDFDGLNWLEGFLSDFKYAVLVVSHDRYFLDRVCTELWEMERGRLQRFPGNYSKYRDLEGGAGGAPASRSSSVSRSTSPRKSISSSGTRRASGRARPGDGRRAWHGWSAWRPRSRKRRSASAAHRSVPDRARRGQPSRVVGRIHGKRLGDDTAHRTGRGFGTRVTDGDRRGQRHRKDDAAAGRFSASIGRSPAR